jgi:N-acetylglucosamine-6-sulfatase
VVTRLAAVVLAAIVALGGATLGNDRAAAGADERPNVVVVMTDDQRAGELRAMRAVRSELAGEGVSFTNAHATFPLCCPSRASFLTGQYAHNHGVMGNEWAEGGGYRAFDNSGSLPVALSRAGYRTAMVGKYMNEYRGPEVPGGWDHWAARTNGETLFDYRLNVDGRRVSYGSAPREYQTDVVARRGARFIRREAGPRPFFLWTSFFAPHGESLRGEERWNPRPASRHRGRFANLPLPEGPAFDERNVADKPSFVRRAPRLNAAQRQHLLWRWRSRQAALLAVDDAVQTLLRELRRTGELESTLVVFTSDNGFLMGEHRLEHKEQLYEEATHVPLIVRGPGFASGEYGGLVGNIDVAPTILAAAGAEPLREPDGVPLQEVLAAPGAWSDRDLLLETARSRAVRTPDWMYAEHRTRRGTERELYDMNADPSQLRSLAGDPEHATVRAALAQRLDELRRCAGAACRIRSGG